MRQLRALSSDLARKAAVELNENPADLNFFIQSLRDWAELQPHMKSRTSDQFLVVFLRSAKYSLEKAKQRLNNFYTYRYLMPEIFKNRNLNDPKVKIILKSGCLLHLPEPVASDGPRVIMLRLKRFNLDKHSLCDVFRVGSMATDLLLYEDDNAIVAGYEVIMDMAEMPTALILNFDAKFVKKLTILANKISPTRMKGFYFLNVPPVFEKLFNMVKSVINVKLRERFYIYGTNYELLYERIPQRILPTEYGGECDLRDLQSYWCEKLIKHREFFEHEDNFGIIEDVYAKSFRGSRGGIDNAAAAAVFDNVFGVNGSFKQLNLD